MMKQSSYKMNNYFTRCPDTTSKLYKSTTEEQAKPTSAKVTANSVENYVYLTAAFPIAKFLASVQIELECTVQGCVTAADTACAVSVV